MNVLNKSVKEELAQLPFNEIVARLSNLFQVGQRQADNFPALYQSLRNIGENVSNTVMDKLTHYVAIKTADRGVALLIVKISFAEDENAKPFMVVKLETVENTDRFSCPERVLKLITDEKARNYKEKITR